MMDRLCLIAFRTSTTPSEIGAALYTLLYGVWYLGPATFSNQSGFRVIATQISEAQFGVAAMTIGLLGIWAVLWDRLTVRRVVVYLNLLWWFFFATFTALASNWTAGGIPHFYLAAVGNGWLAFRLARHVQ